MIRDLLGKFISGDMGAENGFLFQADSEGLNIGLPQERFRKCQQGQGTQLESLQLASLQMLAEEGVAEEIPNGYFIADDDSVLLDANYRNLFNLPGPWIGKFILNTTGLTTQPGFSMRLLLQLPNGENVSHYEMRGPFIKVSQDEVYFPNLGQWQALRAVSKHTLLPSEKRNEYQNLLTIDYLKKAKALGTDLDLKQFEQFDTLLPDKVSVSITQQQDGSALLTPSFGSEIHLTDIETRLGQIDRKGKVQSLRIKDTFVILDEKKLAATHEVLRNRKIKKEDVQSFLKAPAAYLDAELVDLDLGFSYRVHGATKFKHAYFGDTDQSDISWFDQIASEAKTELSIIDTVIKSREDLEQFKEGLRNALATGAEEMTFNGERISLENPQDIELQIDELEANGFGIRSTDTEGTPSSDPQESKPDTAIVNINLHDNEFESDVLHSPSEGQYFYSNKICFEDYLRAPYPHQEHGIRWILGLALEAIKNPPTKGQTTVAGGLLADDMGLGKTYMALAAIREYYKILQEKLEPCKPVLVVAPLGLLGVWKDEVNSTFKTSPFLDIVVLQSDTDLKKYRLAGTGVETNQRQSEDGNFEEAKIRHSLKVGPRFNDEERLDLNRRLVLTTYQALRDYQFSLCSVDWSFVVFDEAQNIKNPNAIQTRAAKGLKSSFGLLVTGTPVENHLGDFWCLFDTVCPGLLSTYQEFRRDYVLPITNTEINKQQQARIDIGKTLRNHVGGLMLRRLKEDNLQGLPEKKVFVGATTEAGATHYMPELECVMEKQQLQAYDAVCSTTNKIIAEEGNRRAILRGIYQLRDVSLHPGLWCNNSLPEPHSREMAYDIMAQSAKLNKLLELINNIKSRDEKIIIFIITKKLQLFIKFALQRIYEIEIDIVNGETKTSSKRNSDQTRKGIIDKFEQNKGFWMLIMSPIAAGVGLTITAANNVIHLERHWNPAKESQATDRVYRIGQNKDVSVYIPILHHPKIKSFEVNLNQLLSKKLDLKDAVVTPNEVTPLDFETGLFGNTRSGNYDGVRITENDLCLHRRICG